MGARILLVEDYEEIAELIGETLRKRGHAVVVVDSAPAAVRQFERGSFDLAILDINLKEGTGWDVCRAIRAHPSRGAVPVVMLTANTALEDKVQGFSLGADNYLTKPIDIAEVLMWADALLRRSSGDWTESASLAAGRLSINPQTRTVRVGSDVLRGLTGKEFDLLYELAKARPGVVSRADLLARVWKENPSTNTLEVHVKTLRRKIGEAAEIVTVRGVGYRIE